MRTVLIGGTIIDGTGGPVIKDGMVVVEGSKIVEVGPRRNDVDADALVLDVSGKTLMPGLIDCELHFAAWNHWVISSQQHPREYYACKSVYAMRRCLESGVTSARDLGGLEVGFCQAQAAGLIRGPRTQTGLVILQPTNGLTDTFAGAGNAITPQGYYGQLPGIPLPWCDGPHQCRAKVREVLRYGAHLVKIANTAWGGNPALRPDRPLFTPEEIEAMVDEAHRAGVQLHCHATGLQATLEALRAGVDIIGHGFPLDEECVEEMARRGTWYLPTFAIWRYHPTERNPDPVARARAT
ncbi:MAG: amidohydrolase family protein, partial [Pseudomonadota bacterium]